MEVLQKYLSLNVLENELRTNYKSNLRVQDFNICIAQNTSDHYCSMLFEIEVNYYTEESEESQQLHIIAKTLPISQCEIDYVNSVSAFESELGMYNEVLPALYKLDPGKKLAPNAFGILSEPNPILLIENLKKLNYKSVSNKECLDVEHCLLVVEKLAYLHGASVAIHEKNPKLVEKYNKGSFLPNEAMTFYQEVGISTLTLACEKIPELRAYRSKFCKEKLIEKINATRNLSKNLNVVNHGDVSVNNLFFYYGSNGKVQDVMFIDFQFPFFGSQALDLQYFWSVCTNIDVKLNHQDTILNHYFKNFVKNLLKFKVTKTPPTIEEFKKEFLEISSFGFIVTILGLSVTLCPKPQVDFENFFTDNSENCIRNECFTNDKFVQHLKLLLPFYDNAGVFD